MEEFDEKPSLQPLGLIWISCPYPVASIGLARVLEQTARVHVGDEPDEAAGMVVLGVSGIEELSEGIERVRAHSPEALVLVFGLYLDLFLARTAFRMGAKGFVHASMPAEQLKRAVEVVARGEIAAPRQLLERLITREDIVTPGVLSARQREILELVNNGLTNAQIARKLYLTESTVKQHLRSAFKALGVSNRTEAARLIRNGD